MIIAYGKSDVGMVREMNQDYYYIANDENEVKLYILADGMGGYKGGEVASSLAVNTVKRYILNNIEYCELIMQRIKKKNSQPYIRLRGLWWRRGESNSCPKITRHSFLRV